MRTKGNKVGIGVLLEYLEVIYASRNTSLGNVFQSLAVRWMNESLERDVLQVSKVTTKGCEASNRRVNLARTAKGGTIVDISEEHRL